MKRTLCIIMTIIMIATMLPCVASAEKTSEKNIHINPIYSDATTESDITGFSGDNVEEIQKINPYARTTIDTSKYCSSIDEASDILREQMKLRDTTPCVNLITSVISDEEIMQIMDDMFNNAVVHTGVPTEGDYLSYVWNTWDCNAGGLTDNRYYYLTFDYQISYYTDSAQESALDSAVSSLKADLDLDNKTDYEKIKGIYDYMTANITYDYDNLEDDTHKLKYTAYAALIDKTAVCQGYAVLLYRLALEYGVDARVISGTSFDERHGWNIIKIGRKYYNADATWDAENTEYSYFLSGTTDFGDHLSDAEFLSDTFKEKYPIAENSYVLCSVHNWDDNYTVDMPATTSKDGMKTIYCLSCDEIKEKVSIPAASNVKLSSSYFTYNNSLISPAIIVKDSKGNSIDNDNYRVVMPTGRVNVGKYVYKVIFDNEYSGAINLILTIDPAKLTSASLSSEAYTYNAKVKTPAVTAKAGNMVIASNTVSDNSNVDITYSAGRKNVGTYKVIVKSRGNFIGTITKTFKINPKGVSISKLTKAKKAFTVKWKKPSSKYRKQMTGYQIRYSTSKKMTKAKTVTVKGTKSTSKKIKSKIKSKKTYYVQLRTYKTVNGIKHYSGWSKTKKIKTR